MVHCKNCRVEYVASVCTSHIVCVSITLTVVLCVCVSHNACVMCTHLQHDSFYSVYNIHREQTEVTILLYIWHFSCCLSCSEKQYSGTPQSEHSI